MLGSEALSTRTCSHEQAESSLQSAEISNLFTVGRKSWPAEYLDGVQEDSFGRFLWRLMTIVTIGLGFIFAVLDMGRPFVPPQGTIGWNPTHAAFSQHHSATIVVDESPPRGSALANARVCAGSNLVLVTPRSYFKLQNIRAGDTVRARIQRPPLASADEACSSDVERSFIAQKAYASSFDYLWAVVRILSLLVAVLVIARQPTHLGALALSGFLGGIGLLCNWSAYPQSFAAVGYFARDFATIVGFPQFILFTASFAPPNSRIARLSWGLFFFFATALAIVVSIESYLYWLNRQTTIVEGIALLATLGTFVAGIGVVAYQTRGASGDRLQRLYWVSGTLVVSLSGGLMYLVLATFHLLVGGLEYVALTLLLLPLGLAYAIQRHRILDFSFAVNRTVVFALLTGVSVPLFGGLEHLTNEQLRRSISPTWPAIAWLGGSSINLAAAVLLFTVAKWLHDRTDKWVGYFLFRSRAQRLAELRRVAKDISGAGSFAALGKNIVVSIDRQIGTGGTAVYFVDNDGSLLREKGSIENAPAELAADEDLALLRVQTAEGYVDLSRIDTEVPGRYAFGMRSGRRFVGLLAMCAKPDGEEVAPDELAAVQTIADSAASAVDTIRIKELENQLLGQTP